MGFMLRNDVGIDLGTASVLVYVKGKGIVLQEPSVVAIDQFTNKFLAVGEEARKMLGRTPGNIVAVRPLKEGVISDYNITQRMLKYFIEKSLGRMLLKPRLIVCVPSGCTEVEKRAVIEAANEEGGVLRVDSFLNHRLDIEFLNEVGLYFRDKFRGLGINKILTIESSGIAIATITAQYLHVPVVFAKKNVHINLPDEVYIEDVHSFTQKKNNKLVVAKKYLNKDDKILIVDDFLAKGNALKALLSMVQKAGGTVEGIGIVIEKTYQGGGDEIRKQGYNLLSLAKIKSMENGTVQFAD